MNRNFPDYNISRNNSDIPAYAMDKIIVIDIQ